MTDPFFEQVYLVVKCIPAGRVATYGQIARILGQQRAARTVGWALRAAPEGSDIPWQRVINSKGAISTGRGDGPPVQRLLLEEEGIVFDQAGRVDLAVYGWQGLDLAERRALLGEL